ncbi:MAG: BrnT family toxin [Cyanobacteria bacterium REEB444]|nr:BrnT family toxin [Cyanobacteria bacterium REEB444]
MQGLLLVVYVDRNKRSRIISARPATRNERVDTLSAKATEIPDSARQLTR